MEKKHNFSTAFKFGRLELLSKLKGGVTEDTPKSELLFLKGYNNLAEFGQNFVKPLKILVFLWGVSVLFQLLVFSLFESTCYKIQNSCQVKWELAGEAFERGTVFSLPPFTLFMNRAIDNHSTPKTNWFTDTLSGSGMVIHAATASLLIFLFALGLKRRLQIK